MIKPLFTLQFPPFLTLTLTLLLQKLEDARKAHRQLFGLLFLSTYLNK